MAKRKNGEGSWGIKKIKGVEYRYFRDVNGKYTYGKTDKEIKQKLAAKKNEAKGTSKMSLEEYLNWYYDTIYKTRIEPTTLRTYKDHIRSMCNYKEYDIGSIRLDMFDKVNNQFIAFFNAAAPHYARNTLKGFLRILRRPIAYAEKNDMIVKGILDEVTVPSETHVGHKKKEIPFLTQEQADMLYHEAYRKCLGNSNYRYGTNAWIVILIMHTGLRIGEARALRWNDVNLEKRIIHIDEAIGIIKKDDKYKEILKSPKNNSSIRDVPLNDTAIEMLKNLEQINPDHKPTDFVCLNKTGKVAMAQNIQGTLNSMIRYIDCGVDHCNLHALRHTFGSLLFAKGVDIKTISVLLGHKDIQTTANVYVKTLHETRLDAVTKIATVASNSNVDCSDASETT